MRKGTLGVKRGVRGLLRIDGHCPNVSARAADSLPGSRSSASDIIHTCFMIILVFFELRLGYKGGRVVAAVVAERFAASCQGVDEVAGGMPAPPGVPSEMRTLPRSIPLSASSEDTVPGGLVKLLFLRSASAPGSPDSVQSGR